MQNTVLNISYSNYHIVDCNDWNAIDAKSILDTWMLILDTWMLILDTRTLIMNIRISTLDTWMLIKHIVIFTWIPFHKLRPSGTLWCLHRCLKHRLIWVFFSGPPFLMGLCPFVEKTSKYVMTVIITRWLLILRVFAFIFRENDTVDVILTFYNFPYGLP